MPKLLAASRGGHNGRSGVEALATVSRLIGSRQGRLFAIGACVIVIAVAGASLAKAQPNALIEQYNRVADLARAGRYAEAIPLGEQLARRMEAEHGPDRKNTAFTLDLLAGL